MFFAKKEKYTKNKRLGYDTFSFNVSNFLRMAIIVSLSIGFCTIVFQFLGQHLQLSFQRTRFGNFLFGLQTTMQISTHGFEGEYWQGGTSTLSTGYRYFKLR